MRGTMLVVVVAWLLVGAVLAPVASAQAGGFDVGQVDADDVLLRADLTETGDAHWAVEYRLRLDDENGSEAFRTLEADVAANPENFTERFGERMRRTARTAENATGREMAIRDVAVRTERRSLPQGEFGIVIFTFEWTNFAAVDGDAITAGDALAGLFLDERTSLMLTWPDGYELRTVTPAADERGDRSVVWRGPADFGPDEPRLTVGTTDAGSGLPVALVGGVAVAILVAGAAATLFLRGEPAPAPVAGESASADDPPEPPDELLSNEERVLQFVEQRGGRVKQQEIAAALDWTDAKTSQVVRDLREDGKLEGFRLGRENVIRLPDDQ